VLLNGGLELTIGFDSVHEGLEDGWHSPVTRPEHKAECGSRGRTFFQRLLEELTSFEVVSSLIVVLVIFT
jgi:hypothetical protein